MDYIKINIQTASHLSDILVAFLSRLNFEAFQEQEGGLEAWVAKEHWSASLEQQLKDLQDQYPFNYQKEEIPHQNWNAKWESDYQAIQLDDFCAVRASFHEAIEAVKYDIVIDPRMAFGTGHHATTSMVMQCMRDLDFKNKTVLDYGCGTGILAILASMMGAKEIHAIDYDPLSTENTEVNLGINKINNVQVSKGELSVVEDGPYDLILANINRNVILESLPRLYELLKKDALLITSGYLLEDENIVKSAAEKLNFSSHIRIFKENWLCLTFIKN